MKNNKDKTIEKKIDPDLQLSSKQEAFERIDGVLNEFPMLKYAILATLLGFIVAVFTQPM